MNLDLRSLNLEEMKDMIASLGEKSFRAKQIFHWIHGRGIIDIKEMTNINKGLLEKLTKEIGLMKLTLVKKQVSKDGTVKYLFKLEDNNHIECVLMKYRGTKSKKRNTLCISTQVGCAMGCSFCATGKGGFTRNLTVSEILGQVYTVNHIEKEHDEEFKVNNIVYMGMGEPLLNFDNVFKSVNLLNNAEGQNIGMRRITVSTCGIVPKIKELGKMKLDLVLAVSLHAPSDELRSEIMPINKKYPLAILKEACKEYIKETNNRITFEYALVEDFNDKIEHTKMLAEFLQGLMCHVNIIPVNPVNAIHVRPSKKRVHRFLEQLEHLGINASIREERGTDIDGACGQLRGKVEG